MIIKILLIAFAVWVIAALVFLCWMLCMVQKMYEEECENNNKKDIEKEDEKDETAA